MTTETGQFDEFFRPNREFLRGSGKIISAIWECRTSVLVQSTRALSDASSLFCASQSNGRTVRRISHILLKYSLSKYSLNVALLGYAAQATSSAALSQSGLMAVRTRSSLERWETFVASHLHE